MRRKLKRKYHLSKYLNLVFGIGIEVADLLPSLGLASPLGVMHGPSQIVLVRDLLKNISYFLRHTTMCLMVPAIMNPPGALDPYQKALTTAGTKSRSPEEHIISKTYVNPAYSPIQPGGLSAYDMF